MRSKNVKTAISADIINSIYSIQNDYINNPFNLPSLEVPHSDEIFLTRTKIAGTSHVARINHAVNSLTVGAELSFEREYQNSYDKYAVLIINELDEKLGYLPKNGNEIFARLLDGGKKMYAKVIKIIQQYNWYDIQIDVFLKD